MNKIEALRKWLFGEQPSLSDVCYEKLFSSDYSDEQAYPELVRRLKPIVHAMAYSDDSSTAEEVTNRIFAEFAQQFPGTPPEEGLLRLAYVIRNAIGMTAFSAGGQALVFYTQLALYHVSGRESRRCLQEIFRRGLSRLQEKSLSEELAFVLGVTVEEATATSQEAWRELFRVMNEDFNVKQLGAWTEGYLPWQPSVRNSHE